MHARFVEDSLFDQESTMPRERIPGHFVGQFRSRAVQLFVVRKRMRIRPGDVTVQKGRPTARANVIDRPMQRAKAGDDVGAIKLVKVKARKIRDQLGDVSPGRLRFHGNGNRVVVVLHTHEQRQLHQRRRVHRFPKLALTGRPVAQGNVHELITVEGDFLKFAVVSVGFPR